MRSNRSAKATVGLVLAGALLIAAITVGLVTQRSAAHPGIMMDSSSMSGMMGSDIDRMMSMMDVMSSPEFKAMIQACHSFMNSPAMQRMHEHMNDHEMESRNGSN